MINKVLVVLMLCWSLVGCMAMTAGLVAGTVAGVYYSNGEMQASFHANLDDTFNATRVALEQMGYIGVPPKLAMATAEVDYQVYSPTNKKATVKLRALTPEVTEVTFRCGFWGDRYQSVRFHTRVAEILEKGN